LKGARVHVKMRVYVCMIVYKERILTIKKKCF